MCSRRRPDYRQRLRATVVLALVSIFVLVWPPTSRATFPGPNGKIAFDDDSAIYVINPDGTGLSVLTTNPVSQTPIWSPDGTKIAFNSNRDGNFDVWVMNADGSGPVNLTNNPASDSGPAWSPDGAQIAFISDRDGAPDLYVMIADGTGQTRLTTGAAPTSLSWAPDGASIAFASLRDGFFAVYVMSANGTGQTRITNNPAGDLKPDWSPDGAKLTFTSIQGGNAQIYVMNPNGTGQTNVSNSASFDAFSSWSPDGTQIQFTTNRDGALSIYRMNADGSGQTRVTSGLRGDWGRAPGPVSQAEYLHASGSVLSFDPIAPTATTAQQRDSASVAFAGGNPWRTVGTWTASSPPDGTLSALGDLHAWLGLKNSDDQGTAFDLRAEAYKNATLVASGLTRCITGITRNPSLAKEVAVAFAPFAATTFNGTTDVLSVKLLTRIGTKPDDTKCPGHNSAVGLRLYFDSLTRPAGFGATFE